MFTSRKARIGAAALALTLVTAACSEDSDDDAALDPAPQTAAAPAPAPDEPMADPAEPMDEGDEAAADIVDTAVGAGDFSTLVAAVQAAGLEETLRSEGPFTVFAPTDAAFAALPEGTVESLLEEPEGALHDILTYHVVAGAVLAADVVGLDGQEVTTVNGATFTVNVTDAGASLTDAAGNEINVVATDIETSNGVIHVIDGILMPS